MEKQIYQKDNIILFATNEDKRLKLRVQQKIDEQKSRIYETVLQSLADGEKLSENFENFQQVIVQIKDNPEGVEIDMKKPAIIIQAQVVGKKSKQVTLGVIPLNQKQIVTKQLEEVLLLKMIEACSNKAELTSDLTKQLVQNMSIGLKVLLEERKQAKEWRLNIENRIKQLEQQNSQLQGVKLKTNNIKYNDNNQSEKSENIELIEKQLIQQFQKQWQAYIKKQDKQLSKMQILKKFLQIGVDISLGKLRAQVKKFDEGKNLQIYRCEEAFSLENIEQRQIQ